MLIQSQVKIYFTKCFLVIQIKIYKSNQIQFNLNSFLADKLTFTLIAHKLFQANNSILTDVFPKNSFLDDITREKLWDLVIGCSNLG